MTTDAATTVAPPQPPAERGAALTEQLHVLVDIETRQYVMGVAAQVAARRGYKYLRQSEVIRDLMYSALARAYQDDPVAFAEAVLKGREVLAEIASETAKRPA